MTNDQRQRLLDLSEQVEALMESMDYLSLSKQDQRVMGTLLDVSETLWRAYCEAGTE